jgi:transcriptional regulator with XRE-family HTH domain
VTTLAKRLGVSKQYVSRAEHGTYSSLNNDLVKYGAHQLHIKPGEFVGLYKKFQVETRMATVENVNPAMLARRSSDALGNEIFVNWRSGYWTSITSFCNAFCVHPEMVRAYEDGIRDEMPAALRSVLQATKLLDPNWYDRPRDQSDTVEKLKILRENRDRGIISTEQFTKTLRSQDAV